MSHANAAKHFVRISGKILGPFGMDQLRSLKSRGRLRAEHEVSLDRRNWNPASDLADLFGESTSRKSVFASEAAAELDQPARSIEWFYAIGEQQQGPVTFQHLKKMASQGTLNEKDLIWHSGLDEWIPAGDQPGLIVTRKSGIHSSKSGKNHAEGQADSQTLLWTALLQQFRDLITVAQLRGLLRSLASIGGIAMLVAMGLIASFYLTLAVKMDSLQMAITGAGALLVASALRFTGLHSLQAGEDLIRNSPQQFTSLAFVKVVSVLLLTVGVLLSSLFFLAAIEVDEASVKIPLMMAAGGILFVFVLGASFILQPEGMNISLAPDAQAGREGIAILSFSMKIWMRLSSFLFIASAILACAGYGTAAYLVAFERERQVLSERNSLDPTLLHLSEFGLANLIASGAIPLGAYLIFAIGSIFLDVCQSLVQLPKASTLLLSEQSQKSGIGSVDE